MPTANYQVENIFKQRHIDFRDYPIELQDLVDNPAALALLSIVFENAGSHYAVDEKAHVNNLDMLTGSKLHDVYAAGYETIKAEIRQRGVWLMEQPYPFVPSRSVHSPELAMVKTLPDYPPFTPEEVDAICENAKRLFSSGEQNVTKD